MCVCYFFVVVDLGHILVEKSKYLLKKMNLIFTFWFVDITLNWSAFRI